MPVVGTGMTLIKEFTYRGDATETFSNTYWFANSGPAPGDTASWLQAFNDLVAVEKPIHVASTSIIGGYGYNDRSFGAHAVFEFVPGAPIAGTFTDFQNGISMAGDQAAMVEWKTNRKNTRGKWVYLRKYIHGGVCENVQTDAILPSYLAALQTYAAAAQVLHGGIQAGPSKDDPTPPVDTIQSHTASPWVTTRTLKRRGKRPRPS